MTETQQLNPEQILLNLARGKGPEQVLAFIDSYINVLVFKAEHPNEDPNDTSDIGDNEKHILLAYAAGMAACSNLIKVSMEKDK